MNKLSECVGLRPGCAHRCQLYAHNPHLICAIHPAGPSGDSCLDFAPDPTAPAPERWEPVGASYYNGELILDSPVERLTREQQLALLDTHPMFTGRCPNCEMPIDGTDPESGLPRVHWDCAECGWVDDSR